METKNKLAYFYGRASTDHQGDSELQQWESCLRFANDKDLLIVNKFYDDGFSGTTISNRPAFQRLLKELDKGEVKYLIVYNTDRISRSLLDSVMFLQTMEELGVTLLSVTQPFTAEDSAESRLNNNIGFSMAQYHVDNTKRLVTRAMRSLAERKLHTGGVPPYGYKIVDKHYAINEEESPAIVIIFQMTADAHSYREISEVLNSKGYRRRNGKLFTNKTIFCDIIHNKRYKGYYVYGKTFKNKNGKYNQHRERRLEEQVIIPGGIPAIVSEELWEEANKLVEVRRHRRGANCAKEIYLLSGLIKCGCGYGMYGNRRTTNYGKYECITYRCSSNNNSPDKECKEIKRDLIENYVLKNLNYYFNDEVAIKVIEYVSNYVIDKYYINNENEVKNAKQRLKNVEKVLGNLVNALAKTGNDEVMNSVVERIKSSEEEKADIINEIANLEKREDKAPQRITQKEIRDSLGNMFVNVVGQKERRKVAKIIDNSVDSVIVYKEKIQINYDLGFVFPELNHFIKMSVTVLKNEMERDIHVLWYEISDIANDEIKIDYKIKRNKEKRQLIFQNGVHKEVVSL